MDIPEQEEQSIEERIGSMIGKIIVLAPIASKHAPDVCFTAARAFLSSPLSA